MFKSIINPRCQSVNTISNNNNDMVRSSTLMDDDMITLSDLINTLLINALIAERLRGALRTRFCKRASTFLVFCSRCGWPTKRTGLRIPVQSCTSPDNRTRSMALSTSSGSLIGMGISKMARVSSDQHKGIQLDYDTK